MKKKIVWNHLIIVYVLLYACCITIGKVVLNQFCNLEFRQWVYLISFFILGFGTIAGVIQLCLKISKKWLKIVCITLFCFIILFLSPYALLFFAFAFGPEHIVEDDGEKMVGYVYGFLDTSVEYYSYVNFIVRGSESIKTEYYGSGAFDPLAEGADYEPIYVLPEEKEENETQKQEEKTEQVNEKEQVENLTEESKEDTEWVFDNIRIRVQIVDYAMGREAIRIQKSEDGGSVWNNTLETENQALWVHYNSTFFFWTEQIGFIFDPGRDGDPQSLATLLVTTDGGKSFQEAEIKGENTIFLKGLPYEKDGELVLEIYENSRKEENLVLYKTNDQGVTWEK